MTQTDRYVDRPQQALIDAAADPVFKDVMDDGDLETLTINVAGTQMAVLALKRDAVRKVVDRIVARCQKSGADIKHWICSPDEFDLCKRLKTTAPGKLMIDLHDFLEKRWTHTGIVLAHVFVIPAAHVVGAFLAILAGLLVANKELVDLCNCQ
jgi:hypothetical protein